MGLSENVGYIPNDIAIFHRDNDQQNHWVQGFSLFSDTSRSKDYHHLNLPPLGGGLVHGGGRHGDAAADPLGDAGGAIYSTGTETIDDHQGSAHQGSLVLGNMTSMTFHKNWECHLIPTDELTP